MLRFKADSAAEGPYASDKAPTTAFNSPYNVTGRTTGRSCQRLPIETSSQPCLEVTEGVFVTATTWLHDLVQWYRPTKVAYAHARAHAQARGITTFRQSGSAGRDSRNKSDISAKLEHVGLVSERPRTEEAIPLEI